MGEPVTEEMMRAAIERYGRCVARDFALGVDTTSEQAAAMRDALAVFAMAGPMPGEVAAANLAANAAGYARAERDVVAWLRQRADDMGDGRDELSRDEAVSQGTVYVASDDIKQGAHRGAAKEGT